MAISYSIPPRKKRDFEKMERSHVNMVDYGWVTGGPLLNSRL